MENKLLERNVDYATAKPQDYEKSSIKNWIQYLVWRQRSLRKHQVFIEFPS